MESLLSFHRIANRLASGGGRRPMLIAALGLAFCAVGVAVFLYAGDLIELASLLTSSRAIHTQGHTRY